MLFLNYSSESTPLGLRVLATDLCLTYGWKEKRLKGGLFYMPRSFLFLFIFKCSYCGLTPNTVLVFACLSDTQQKREEEAVIHMFWDVLLLVQSTWKGWQGQCLLTGEFWLMELAASTVKTLVCAAREFCDAGWFKHQKGVIAMCTS